MFYNTTLLCWVGKMVSQNECVFFCWRYRVPKMETGKDRKEIGKHKRFRDDGLVAGGSALDIMLDERVD